MSDTTALPPPLDEASRPKAPPIPGATAMHRNRGLHLAEIHRWHLAEIDHLHAIMARIAEGAEAPGALAAAVPGLDMTRNFRAFGTLCGRECRVLTFHHDAEEMQIFPALEQAGSPGLAAVVARLRQEHLLVHHLIERLDRDADRLEAEPGPESFAAAGDTLRELTRVVRSHFGYEETELAEALGWHGLV